MIWYSDTLEDDNTPLGPSGTMVVSAVSAIARMFGVLFLWD